MSLRYHLHEGSIMLPGMDRDATLQVVHFTNEQGQARQMIASREKLTPGSTLAATVEAQLAQLRKEPRQVQVGEAKDFSITTQRWPAKQVAVILGQKGAKHKSWQLHVMAQTPDELLLTLTLVSPEPIDVEEQQQWLARVQAFAARSDQHPDKEG